MRRGIVVSLDSRSALWPGGFFIPPCQIFARKPREIKYLPEASPGASWLAIFPSAAFYLYYNSNKRCACIVRRKSDNINLSWSVEWKRRSCLIKGELRCAAASTFPSGTATVATRDIAIQTGPRDPNSTTTSSFYLVEYLKFERLL
jgi:hypothetical protein